MKDKILSNARMFLVIQLNHWMLAPAAFLLVLIWKYMTGVQLSFPYLLWMTIGMIPVYFLFLRKKFTTVFVSVLMHLLALIGLLPVFLLAPGFWALYAISVIGYTIYSVSYRFSATKIEDGMISAFGGVAVFAVVSFFLYTLKERESIEQLVIWMLFMIGGFFPCYFLMNVHNYMMLSKDTVEAMPRGRIIRTGMYVVAGFSVVLIGLAFLMTRFREVSFLSDVLIGVLRWIVMTVMFLMEKVFSNEKTVATLPRMVFGKQEEGEFAWLTDIMNYAVTLAVIIALCYFAFVIIRKIIYFLSHKDKKMVVEDLEGVEDVHERISLKEKGSSLRDFFNTFTPEEKIRRIYKKTVTENRTQISGMTTTQELGYYTARECAVKLENRPFDAIYEKARYSTEECTPEDVREMKRLSKEAVTK